MHRKQKSSQHRPNHRHTCRRRMDWSYRFLTGNQAISGLDAGWWRRRCKPQQAMLSVDGRPPQELSMQTSRSFVAETFDCSEPGIFWSCHIPHIVFCSRTPNHLPSWFTQYGCCIPSTSPVSGGVFPRYGLGITMAWNSPHLDERVRAFTLQRIQIMVGDLPTTPLEFGTIFCNTTWAWLDQEGFGLASTGAKTHWPPKI